MIECKILLNNINKIANFIKVVSKIEEDVDLYKGHYVIDAKSIVALFTIQLDKPVLIKIHSDDKSLLNLFNEWRIE